MKRRVAILAVAALVGLLPVLAFAIGLQTVVPQDYGCNGPGGCNSVCALAELAQNALNDGIYVAIFLSAILFAWAGWQMVTGSAAGNETQVHHAKDIFWYVMVGLVLILSAWILVSVIMAALTGNNSWNYLCGQNTTPAAPAATAPAAPQTTVNNL